MGTAALKRRDTAGLPRTSRFAPRFLPHSVTLMQGASFAVIDLREDLHLEDLRPALGRSPSTGWSGSGFPQRSERTYPVSDPNSVARFDQSRVSFHSASTRGASSSNSP